MALCFQLFEIAGGSVAGRDHRKGIPRNKQDTFCVRQTKYGTVAIVADGCGSGKHSEVGARLAVRLLSTALDRYLARGLQPNGQLLARAGQELLSSLHMLAKDMGESLSEVVHNHFLFTLIGMVSTASTTMFFSLGDGVLVINDETTILDSGPDNAPDYFGYRLLGKHLEFNIVRTMPTCEVERFLLGSDGVVAMIENAERHLPGTSEVLGPLSQFCENDKYFRAGDIGIERRLNLAARDWPKRTDSGQYVMESGFLPDDTTLVVGRKSLITIEEE